MIKEFREFILRGNVVDLAVAVVIGAAFGAVVTAFVADIITPIVAAIVGKPDFAGAAVHDQRVGVPVRRLLQRRDLVRADRRCDLLLRRQARERPDGAAQGQGGARPAAPPEDVQLLTEIRDLLAASAR